MFEIENFLIVVALARALVTFTSIGIHSLASAMVAST